MVHFAVEGCCHGELDIIYARCKQHESLTGDKLDFVLCCGDFQSTATEEDLQSMAVPDKFRTLGDFPKYLSTGAPYLTIFIGGNHEASNVLYSQYYGGYVAPNIYYLGHAGVVDVCGIRIGGLSGIFKGHDAGRSYPAPPYTPHTVRTAYHTRTFELRKLEAFAEAFRGEDGRAVDVMLSHDWPVGITKFGDEQQLIRHKPFFEADIATHTLGNPHTLNALRTLRPTYWFAAHLHCYFHGVVDTNGVRTEFYAQDKCVRERKFISFFDMRSTRPISEERIIIPAEWMHVLACCRGVLSQSLTTGSLPEGPIVLPPKPFTTKAITASVSELVAAALVSDGVDGTGGHSPGHKRERNPVPIPTTQDDDFIEDVHGGAL